MLLLRTSSLTHSFAASLFAISVLRREQTCAGRVAGLAGMAARSGLLRLTWLASRSQRTDSFVQESRQAVHPRTGPKEIPKVREHEPCSCANILGGHTYFLCTHPFQVCYRAGSYLFASGAPTRFCRFAPSHSGS